MTVVLSHESRPRHFSVSLQVGNDARSCDAHELIPVLHQQACSGTRATSSEGEKQPRALRRTRMEWDDMVTPDDATVRLARAVRVRLPSARPAALHWPSSAAPCAHPALGLPAAAPESLPFVDLPPKCEQLSRWQLHGWMRNSMLHPTMRCGGHGDVTSRLQPRCKTLSETNRDFLSDWFHLGLDPAC